MLWMSSALRPRARPSPLWPRVPIVGLGLGGACMLSCSVPGISFLPEQELRVGVGEPFPSSLMVDGAVTIRWALQSDTYRQRARPEDAFAAIEGLGVAGR